MNNNMKTEKIQSSFFSFDALLKLTLEVVLIHLLKGKGGGFWGRSQGECTRWRDIEN